MNLMIKFCWWVYAGQAKIIEDHEEIKKIWNSSLSAWFGNLGDGKHTGNYDDPRVAAIQVKPTEIRYVRYMHHCSRKPLLKFSIRLMRNLFA
jgi:general stress protein 26